VDATTGRRAFEPGDTTLTGTAGWVIDLNKPSGTGERVVSAPLIYDSTLIFSSIVPPPASTVNSCDAGGSGYVNVLDAFTGASVDTPFFVDLDVTTVTDTSTGKKIPVGSLPIEAGMPTAPIIVGNQWVVGDSSGGPPGGGEMDPPGGSATRRVSWRELLNDL
jgi:type IV pilus assembly protein PilY1